MFPIITITRLTDRIDGSHHYRFLNSATSASNSRSIAASTLFVVSARPGVVKRSTIPRAELHPDLAKQHVAGRDIPQLGLKSLGVHVASVIKQSADLDTHATAFDECTMDSLEDRVDRWTG
jgi:hypothetical protein